MAKAEPSRWALPEMLALAARGVGKVNHHGPRGTTLVSMVEIEAMALALVAYGLAPIPPGSYPPANEITHTEGERE